MLTMFLVSVLSIQNKMSLDSLASKKRCFKKTCFKMKMKSRIRK